MPLPSASIPVPGTVAAISLGPPNFSAPVVMSSACSLWNVVPLSSVMAETYNVCVTGSITGVPVTPTRGPMPVRPPKLPSAGVIPFAGSMKLRFHKILVGSSASSA